MYVKCSVSSVDYLQVSEWDSDLEDMVNPVTSITPVTPTPPPPPPDAPITKEVGGFYTHQFDLIRISITINFIYTDING